MGIGLASRDGQRVADDLTGRRTRRQPGTIARFADQRWRHPHLGTRRVRHSQPLSGRSTVHQSGRGRLPWHASRRACRRSLPLRSQPLLRFSAGLSARGPAGPSPSPGRTHGGSACPAALRRKVGAPRPDHLVAVLPADRPSLTPPCGSIFGVLEVPAALRVARLPVAAAEQSHRDHLPFVPGRVLSARASGRGSSGTGPGRTHGRSRR
jgi:hypothetical protein